MKTITLKIDSTLNGRKIENVLEKHLGLSRSLIARLKRTDGGILLNGEGEKVTAAVREGDVLTVNVRMRNNCAVVGTEMELDILYEDDDIIAVNKPPFMPTHPSRNHKSDTLANGIMHHLGENGEIHIITRLDRDTSGVVLAAKNAVAAKILTEEMKNGNIQKEYIAAVNGSMKTEKGIINAPVKRAEGIKRAVCPDGKSAVTEYEVIKSGEFSVVRLFPKTGRTHQLRVHMSYIGHPIFGDSMYGAPQKGERCRLHCRKIGFYHPEAKAYTEIIAPLPKDMECLV